MMEPVINKASQILLDLGIKLILDRYQRFERHLKFWIILFIIIFSVIDLHIFINSKFFFDFMLFLKITFILFILSSFFLQIIWPLKNDDYFEDNFDKGISRKKWAYDGDWRIDNDTFGRNVLSVSNSTGGGLAIPCKTWVNYELIFEVSIVGNCAGWIIHTTDLTDGVIFMLRQDEFSYTYRYGYSMDLDPLDEYKVKKLDNGEIINLKLGTFYKVRNIVHGKWISVIIEIGKIEYVLLQKEVFMPIKKKPELGLWVLENGFYQPTIPITSFAFGSFGFRCHNKERAYFRNVKAYRLK